MAFLLWYSRGNVYYSKPGFKRRLGCLRRLGELSRSRNFWNYLRTGWSLWGRAVSHHYAPSAIGPNSLRRYYDGPFVQKYYFFCCSTGKEESRLEAILGRGSEPVVAHLWTIGTRSQEFGSCTAGCYFSSRLEAPWRLLHLLFQTPPDQKFFSVRLTIKTAISGYHRVLQSIDGKSHPFTFTSIEALLTVYKHRHRRHCKHSRMISFS